jgi:hypothetical protein
MTTVLLESDFLTVNLGSILNKPAQKTEAPTGNDVPKATEPAASTQKVDWGKELASRLEANKKMSPESRESEYEIERKFWQEYFTAGWGDANAQLLMALGDQLRSDIKVLGFKKSTNPIIAFLKLSYVQKELLQTELLNKSTYKAIHQAKAKKYVADTEFFRASDYNILYCKDLYNKTATEMVEYFKEQAMVLKPTASRYTLEDQNKNKRVFLLYRKNNEKTVIDQAKAQLAIPDSNLASVKHKTALLNSIKLIQTIIKISGSVNNTNNYDDEDVQDTEISDELAKVIVKIKEPAQILAAIQYLSIISNSEKAKKVLMANNFSGVSVEELKAATAKIAGIFTKASLSAVQADTLISSLLAKIK